MKKVIVMMLIVLVCGVISADDFGTGANKFTIDFVEISGDTNPTSGYGIVNNDYLIGTYEITNDQFAKFTENYPHHTGADVPANRIRWFEAAQFVNFLNTITGNQAAYKFSSNTMSVWDVLDTGYDANNPYRNSNSKYFLPTENEWFKAAYWNGTSLQTYANASFSDLISGSPDPTKLNYSASAESGPWNVGSGSEELNGTFDMMGNVRELLESPYFSGNYLSGSNRGLRGGSYRSFDSSLSSSGREEINPSSKSVSVGFRVASVTPEPCSLVLLSLGGIMLRRRKP